ncbi:transcription-repair coupling factor [Buchnera aphidicola]|uniref:Transcription-repair-coupling factor n=1 Tax=Buchnera aphidicola subsp. Rhopalosiphum maidis TaxID=118109 RepID=A0A3G2I5R3_BUCRM|nr:transcription-repair coupling factor [Buchnera aphidicola]AYN24772.1 transcription-repair coupling factor [Buchnera aphidicola (Rhopalosiphum maidis)]
MIKKNKKIYISDQLILSVIPFECASIIENHSDLVVLITSNIKSSLQLEKLTKYFTNRQVIVFPDWQILPYDHLSPDKKIISSRISTLYNLSKIKKGLLIIAVQTLLQKICPYKYLYKESFLIQKDNFFKFKNLISKLEKIGYCKRNEVKEIGDFSIKKSLIDIYPVGSISPYRIFFEENKIFNLKLFNINNQLTFKEKESIVVMPRNEFPKNKDGFDIFKKNYNQFFSKNMEFNKFYKSIFEKKKFFSVEYLQSFFFEKPLSTLFDYLSEKTLIIYQDQYKNNSNEFWKKITERYNLLQKKYFNIIIKPEKIWITTKELSFFLKKYCSIQIVLSKDTENKNSIKKNYKKLPECFMNANTSEKFSFLKNFSGKIIFSLTKEDCIKTFLKILASENIYPKYIKNITDFNQNFNYLYIIGNLYNGFINIKRNFLFVPIKKIFPNFNQNKSLILIKKNILQKKKNHLDKLKLNDLIIHIEHGIGRYQGLTKIKTASIESEYLVILYAEQDKLYVPISHLHLISPYIGILEKNIPLHKLGGGSWNKEKTKINKTLYDHAAILLDIYSKRLSQNGFSFQINEKNYKLFCKDFPFKTTLDQNDAIKSVLNDMKKSIPMDRLICGDVGFGKTEVAMRAAFICVSNYKQVVILVPTTLLAQQHFDNFKKRFHNWSVKIDILSRFRNETEQKNILTKIKNGDIKILIGTHKILLKNINWYNLGLLIIDEEHRFGVNHKEIIKKTYSNIDILTLTATPIPRTLNMAMTGIKDLSIISQPPQERLKIKSFIEEYNPILVKEAILREISRGGQVYYIYNKVQNINNIAKKLSNLVPEAHIKIGHGQMKNTELKKIMNEFYHHHFDVLVCTTIIESGIDVPKANTMIIENSDYFGLSQLHQLRGRIGRSNHQAYSFFLVNNLKKITSEAKKRLNAISLINNFGGGFTLSNKDLEIRGIGELLGKEQSGHIQNIGFSLYLKLLKKAIEILKNGGEKPLLEELIKKSDIELYVPSLLPSSYIFDVNKRLFYYKKLSNVKNKKDIEKIKFELIDQFGKLPLPAKNLILISKIRLLTEEIGILCIKSNGKRGIIEFDKQSTINTEYLLKLFKQEPHLWKMENSIKLHFFHNFKDNYTRLKWIKDLLKNIK